MKKQRVYELTTNGRGGFVKYFVRGIRNDTHARRIAKLGFGKAYYSKSLISYYDDYPSKYGTNWETGSLTISEFLRKARRDYR